MYSYRITVLLLVHTYILINGNLTEKIIFNSSKAGLFSNFNGVIGALEMYESNNYAGITVHFDSGLYLDTAVGPTWWEYYFEPIDIVTTENAIPIYLTSNQKSECSRNAISTISREKAHKLIQKYIHVKPYLHEIVDNFVEHHFADQYVIGIHYRGTDKIKEASYVSPEEVYRCLQKIIAQCGRVDYIVFIATEDQRFIDYITTKISPDKLCYFDTIRSNDGKPIHFDIKNGYQLGKEAVIDCLTLARTSFLIKTQSNVSAAAANFNPYVPIISLNQRYSNPNIR